MAGVFDFESIYEDKVMFDPTLPPIFDDYGDEEVVVAILKEPYYSFDTGHEFEIFANPIKNAFGPSKFQGCYFGDLQTKTVDTMFRDSSCLQGQFVKQDGQPSYSLAERCATNVRESACSIYLFEGVVRDELIRLVHGGWWGGWHKGFLKNDGQNELESGSEFGPFLYVDLLLLFAYLLVILVFDPGGVMLQELRSILFKGGGDDPKWQSSNAWGDIVAFDVKELHAAHVNQDIAACFGSKQAVRN